MILSTAARNAMLLGLTGLLDAGTGAGSISGYDGTQPAGPDTAVSSQNLLCVLGLSEPAFEAPVGGTTAADTITPDNSADASGTCTWMRWADGDGVAVFDTSVGTSGEDINFNTNVFAAGDQVSITSFTITQPAS